VQQFCDVSEPLREVTNGALAAAVRSHASRLLDLAAVVHAPADHLALHVEKLDGNLRQLGFVFGLHHSLVVIGADFPFLHSSWNTSTSVFTRGRAEAQSIASCTAQMRSAASLSVRPRLINRSVCLAALQARQTTLSN
jgi:hypothetical protein